MIPAWVTALVPPMPKVTNAVARHVTPVKTARRTMDHRVLRVPVTMAAHVGKVHAATINACAMRITVAITAKRR